jgi:hypothetical protein
LFSDINEERVWKNVFLKRKYYIKDKIVAPVENNHNAWEPCALVLGRCFGAEDEPSNTNTPCCLVLCGSRSKQ